MSTFHTSRRWQKLRRWVKDRDGWRCVKCGSPGRLDVDHITPSWRGGDKWSMSNLQTLCRRCHREKTALERGLTLPPDVAAWRAYAFSSKETTDSP